MCGIAGIVQTDGSPAPRHVLERMTRALAHRGPDGEGAFCEGAVGLGHRRLAIIDPSPAGNQPMITSDGSYVLTYNGELYNFHELRVRLEARGHRFRSHCDTEVVLAALVEWGTDALLEFNGMFAFALYDTKRRVVVIARDRFGVKPIYYTKLGHSILFASEIKAFLEHPEYHPSLDLESLVEYLSFQNLFTDRTLFTGVHLLPPATWMRISIDEGSISTTRYWDYTFEEPEEAADGATYEEELDRLFRQAVTRQLIGDVPIGSYLSGGMDTGAVTAIASRELNHMRTFTIGFDTSSVSGLELAFDERPQAERLSYLFKTEHYEMVLKAGDMERVLPQLIWSLEEPRVGQSYPNFFAAKLAGSFDKVVLSGAGGDELFAGYPWRYYRALGSSSFSDFVKRYDSFWQRIVPIDSRDALFAPIKHVFDHVNSTEILRGVFGEGTQVLETPEDYINHSLYFEAKTFLHGLLVLEDKLSMAHGLEIRVPFLDNDLVNFATRVPVALKLAHLGNVEGLDENELRKRDRYFLRTRDGKLILRKVLGRYLPADFTTRPKQGFSAPDATWYRGESIDYVRRCLSDGARLFEFLDRNAVNVLVDDHLEGRANRRLLIWSLLCLEEWLRIFIEGQRPADTRGW